MMMMLLIMNIIILMKYVHSAMYSNRHVYARALTAVRELD